MKTECVELLIQNRREIEFIYKGEWYSITYSDLDSKEDVVSFCKYYKEPIDIPFEKWPEVLEIKIGNLTINEIVAKLPDEAFVIG